ncbi:MAG: lipase [Euryarchaeota archaeon]|nr:lipase [Euryarchaeota archaeon]|tara:strand:- start:4525 stop:5361 length:837 start_codon:yes stop_codon:yes gene_type:complete
MFSDKLTTKIAELDFNNRALLFAELSRVAYFTEYHATRLAKRLGFTTVEYYNIDGAEAYRFMNKRDIVFACRGTQPKQYNDIKADARAFPVVAETIGRVHGGFKGEVDKLWDKIQEDIIREQAKRDVWFTGHSLGAAMSTILASRCRGETTIVNPQELFTFGSPRVGWASYINNFPFKHYRFVNNADIVCRVPFYIMGYRHHGECQYFNHYGNLRNLTGWQRTKDTWRGIFRGLAKGKFDSVADHNIKQYILHIKKMVDGQEAHQPSFIENYAHMYER